MTRRTTDRGSIDARGAARRYLRGEPEEIERVRRRVRAILAHHGYGIPPHEREDLEQEVMTQLWQALAAGGRAAHEGFGGLVRVVSVRRSIDWLRARKPLAPADESLASHRPGPAERALSRERIVLLAEAVARLKRPCRELIERHFDHGEPLVEIARRDDRSAGAVRIQMFRCIRSLRSIVAELEAGVRAAAGGRS